MATKLNNDQINDARRLKAIYEARKAEDKSLTQESLASECGWKTQSAVQQYLNGLVPLNLSAAIKFARALRVSVKEISPQLAAEIESANVAPVAHQHLSQEALKIALAFDLLTNEAQKRAIQAQLSAFGVYQE